MQNNCLQQYTIGLQFTHHKKQQFTQILTSLIESKK